MRCHVLYHTAWHREETASLSQYPGSCLCCDTGRKWKVISEPRISRWLTLFKKVSGGGVLSAERLPRLHGAHPSWVRGVARLFWEVRQYCVSSCTLRRLKGFLCTDMLEDFWVVAGVCRQEDVTPCGVSAIIYYNLGSPCFVSHGVLMRESRLFDGTEGLMPPSCYTSRWFSPSSSTRSMFYFK